MYQRLIHSIRNSPSKALRRLAVLFFAASLAACASTPSSTVGRGASSATVSQAGANPHWKVGAPYRIKGRTYRPRIDRNYNETGLASWYGDQFHGRQTANGEIFDKTLLSAAHKTLPLPILAEVRNLENGRTIRVRINDRGPFVDDRLIDLSEAAAEALGFREKGLAPVQVRYLRDADLYALAEKPSGEGPSVRYAAAEPPTPPILPTPSVRKAVAPTSAKPEKAPEPVEPVALGFTEASFAVDQYWVEIAAFRDLREIDALPPQVASLGAMSVVTDRADGAPPLHSVRLGPYIRAGDASRAKADAVAAGFANAVILLSR